MSKGEIGVYRRHRPESTALYEVPELPRTDEATRRGEEPCRQREARPWAVARYLAAVGELTEVPGRSPPRPPPYWKGQVLRRKALGNQGQGGDDRTDQRAASPRGTRRRRKRTGSQDFRRGRGASPAAEILALCSPLEVASGAPACSWNTPPRRPKPLCGPANALAHRPRFAYAPRTARRSAPDSRSDRWRRRSRTRWRGGARCPRNVAPSPASSSHLKSKQRRFWIGKREARYGVEPGGSALRSTPP